ncbi:MAG TPA: hypothetical protein DCF33_19020, partial [Saprospirales bacterium]|nr:hypothetical protein [Saprospirales bacterium]
NKFKLNNLLLGYSWENSYKNTSVSYPAALKWVQFNTVQGWLLDVRPEWKKDSDDRATSFWRANGALNYGFSEQKVRGSLKVQRRFDSIKYRTLSLEGGTTTEQFNDRTPISSIINTSYSLFAKRNYMKLYDKTFARMEYSQILRTGISFLGAAEWAQRGWLDNTSSFSYKRKTTREYTSNEPVPTLDPEQPGIIEPANLFILQAQFVFRVKQQYSSYPKYRAYQDSNWPEFILSYKSAIPLGGSDWA